MEGRIEARLGLTLIEKGGNENAPPRHRPFVGRTEKLRASAFRRVHHEHVLCCEVEASIQPALHPSHTQFTLKSARSVRHSVSNSCPGSCRV
jgi:hypothetical protein